MNQTMHRTRGMARDSVGRFLPFIRGLGGGILSALVLLLLGAGIACSADDPARLTGGMSLGILYLSSLICGIFSGWGEEDALLLGAISGGIYCGILVLLSLAFTGNGMSLPLSITLHGGIVLASMAGAYLSRKRRRRSTLSYKKRRR